VKYSSNGMYLGTYDHGYNGVQGCVVGLNDDVWFAHSFIGTTVRHLANNGTLLGIVTVGDGPTGIAVNRAGKVWATNYGISTILRIDPSLNAGIGGVDKTVNLGPGFYPYNYGNMTGSTNIDPSNSGSWTVIYDHGSVLEPWESIVWTADTPLGSSLTMQVKNNKTNPRTTVEDG
jgi:DNA-binding beta-propeller fold protein YncE